MLAHGHQHNSLSANLVVARAGPQQLTDKERKVLGHVRSRIFSNKLKGKEGWEGVEVAAYWTVIGKRVVLRDVYGGGGEAITGEAAPAKASSAAAAMDGRSKRQRVARG